MRPWFLLAALAVFSVAPAQAQYPLSLGGTGFDTAYNVDYGPDGTALVTGQFTGTADFGGTSLISAGGADGFVASYNAAGVLNWVKRFGSADGGDAGQDVVYNDGLLHITGFISEAADYDGTPIVPFHGGTDALLATVDATTGALIWAEALGSDGNDVGEDLTLAPYGGEVEVRRQGSGATASKTGFLDFMPTVFVVGTFRRTGEFNPLGPSFLMTSAGNSDAFVAGYSALSGLIYDAIPVGGKGRDEGTGIDYDRDDGRIWAGGIFRRKINTNPNGAPVNLTSAGSEDGWVASYDFSAPPALVDVAFDIGGTDSDRVYDVAVGNGIPSRDRVYITGDFKRDADFNGSILTSVGSRDGFVTAHDDVTGAFVWGNTIGSPNRDTGYGLDVDACENVYAVGLFQGTATFSSTGPSPDLVHTSAGNMDAYVSSYTSAGDLRFANQVGGIRLDRGWGVAAEYLSGEHFAVGDFRRDASFTSASLPAPPTVTSAGNSDGWVAAYTVNGVIAPTACICPPVDLEVWYDFDAWIPGGTPVFDITAPITPPNDGSPTPGVAPIAGAVDVGGFFPSGDFLSSPADPTIEMGPRDLTIDAWVKVYTTDPVGPVTVASKWLTTPAGDEIGYDFTLVPFGGGWDLVLTLGDGATLLSFSSTAVPLPPDMWKFVAVRAERSGGGTLVTFFYEGVVLGTIAGPVFGPIINPPAPLRVHASALVPAPQERAGLDEIEITFASVSDARIADIYRFGKCKLCIWWQFQPPHGGFPQGIGTTETETPPEAVAKGTGLTLDAPFPNPARNAAMVVYSLDHDRAVRLEVLDATGRVVAVLADGVRPEGRHETSLDASTLPSGVYLVRLVSEGQTVTRRLTLLR